MKVVMACFAKSQRPTLASFATMHVALLSCTSLQRNIHKADLSLPYVFQDLMCVANILSKLEDIFEELMATF